jgi:hypothetical protein
MTLDGITHTLINVDFLTPDYRVVGKVMVSSSGLLGLLTDPNRNFVEVKQAQIAYMHQPTQLVRQFENARVFKERLFVAFLERREDMGPQLLAHRGYTNFQRYPLHLAASGYEIDMFVEWTGRFDMSSMLAEGTRNFVPGYMATISSSAVDGWFIESPAVLVNFGRIELIAPSLKKSTEAIS